MVNTEFNHSGVRSGAFKKKNLNMMLEPFNVVMFNVLVGEFCLD